MRRATPAEAAALLRPRDALALPLGPGQPPALLHALGEREDFQELTVFSALLVDAFALFAKPGVRLLSGFYGPVERGLRDAGHRVEFVPADFRRFADIARRLAPRVMATAATPPDAEGWCSLSLHAGATPEELRRCGRDPERVLIVEANARLPRTLGLPHGYRHALHVDEIDWLVEVDREVVTLPDPEPSATDRAIARHACTFVQDGCTLQTGIGGVPNAIAADLARAPGGDYGVHTEMFTDGLMRLQRAGKVSNARKGHYDGLSIATFAMGTRELYDWLGDGGRESVRFLPVEQVNDPAEIARNRALISINGALSVDLEGQLVADQIGGRVHSGIGGHEDFAAGAARSPGGRSLVCLPSTARVGGETVSRIVRSLDPGTVVTTPRHRADVIVTEHGVAELMGATRAERHAALRAIAHPDFRDALDD